LGASHLRIDFAMVVVGLIDEDVDHTVEQNDEIFNLRALPALDHLQFFARPFVDRTQSARENVREIVAGPYPHAVEQRHDQRVALLGEGVLFQIGSIQASMSRKLSRPFTN
jgi:hypothetical protein